MLAALSHFQRIVIVSTLPMLAFVVGLVGVWNHVRFSLEQQGGTVLGVGLVCGGLLAVNAYVLYVVFRKVPVHRVLQAMDVCQANVMIADNGMNITYLNKPSLNLFKRNEAALRKAIPGFYADQLMGINVDVFHSNPSHQRRLIESLTAPQTTEIKIAGLSFDLVATPLFDAKQLRVGTVIEWHDKTEQHDKTGQNALYDRQQKLAAEQQKPTAAQQQPAAENTRVTAALEFGESNGMMAESESSTLNTNDSVKRNDYQGMLDQLKQDTHIAVDTLAHIVAQITQSARAIASDAQENASSKKVSDVIAVIDEMAFQANLLALNAVVDGARAGTALVKQAAATGNDNDDWQEL